MNSSSDQKVTASHLQRDAYLYVRQSTLRQVFENTESTKRQYGLRQRPIALGWQPDQVIVIDTDLGQSGASSKDREGFQRLVTEVGLGRAGIVLGLEVSRLARNSTDWHRLLEICALTDTLILDVMEPDQQVQASIAKFFKAFEETGSATATVKQFRQQGWKFPRKLKRGARLGEVVWGELVHSRALQLLHNPRYAGAFFFGRTHNFIKLPPDQWHTLLLDTHVGYISWDQFQANRRQLSANAQTQGIDRRKSPPGEGGALLQGIATCGCCGKRMTIRYNNLETTPVPRYMCQRQGIEQGHSFCQSIPGQSIDQAISELLMNVVTPLAMEVTLGVQCELQSRRQEADGLRRQQVERARYEAELARTRFMQVDPLNRLVADTLEGEWNDRLRAVNEAQEIYEQHTRQDSAIVNDSTRSEVLEMASNFPKLWSDPRTSNRDRKKIVRLLIEDVTLKYGAKIELHVRFKGGASQSLELTKPLNAWELRQTNKEVIQAIDLLLNDFPEGQVAEKLNERGLRSGMGSIFTANLVGKIRRTYQLASRFERLRKAGLLTQRELAEQLDIHPSTVRRWRDNGLVKSTLLAYHHQNSINACFLVAEAVKAFEPLAPAANPTKRLTRSATGIRKWWRSARSVVKSQFYNDKNEALYEPMKGASVNPSH